MKSFLKNIDKIHTLGQLRESDYRSQGVKSEMRENLMEALKSGQTLFKPIKGYEDSVIPHLENAILSRHNIILLGLRGQAKTRLSRLMVDLLDEYVPVIDQSELNDDPFHPLSSFGRDRIQEAGDDTPISWLHRDERYIEKLATPDVSVADLIGDLDPIKAAALRLTYADERVIHYGLIPRSHRCIFVINELPDLQPRIQVALFNILQEGDIQIRGFRLRLPLDIQFVFTANPEDYTNRGSIVTPLKDRIGSQILTHYPRTVEISASITQQESKIPADQKNNIHIPPLLLRLIEQVAFEARKSEYIDQKSGVSARLTISALENLYSAVQRRMLMNNEKSATARIADLYGAIPAITGKVELVYEGELEGIANVAYMLIGKAIRAEYVNYFPDPERMKKSKQRNPYVDILQWFNEGNELDILHTVSQKKYNEVLTAVKGLKTVMKEYVQDTPEEDKLFLMEFILHGLSEYSQISKRKLDGSMKFSDLVGSIFKMDQESKDE